MISKPAYKSTIFVIILCISGVILGIILSRTATPDTLTKTQKIVAGSQEQEIASVVEKALSQPPPSGYASIPSGVRLLSVKIQEDKIILDFSKELLLHGKGSELEDVLHQIFVKLGNEVPHIVQDKGYTVLIEGVLLEQYLN
jgi:hypothetical protein